MSSLESISFMTEHAFENMNMRIISAGQHIELEKWQNQMELAGYKLEGLHSKDFISMIMRATPIYCMSRKRLDI